MNTKQLDAVGDIVGALLAEALAPIRRELLTLTERLAAIPAPVEVKAGPTLEEVTKLIEAAVKALPVPKDGEPGKDGTSVTLDQVQPLIEAAVKALPVPKDGAPGKDGTSVTLDQVQPLIEAAVKALPVPKDGRGMAGSMIDRDGELQMTMTDGTVCSLGPVVGKSLESFTMEYLPETHEVRLTASCAGRLQELRYDAGGIRLGEGDRGYWRDGTKAKALEAYSFDGNLWIARKATTAKPGPESADWVLAARQGRPGPAGKDFNAPRVPEPIKVGK